MAPSSTGKWVSRVAATGGGRTYRGQRPVNWYAALVVIVILGIVSLVVARYNYQHPHKASAVQPAVGTTLYAGFAIDICGAVQPPLPASTKAAGITTPGQGVLNVSPTTPAEAGNHATLGQFFSNYPGALLTATRLEVNNKTYLNGQTCKAKTPTAGKKAYVTVEMWPNALSQQSTVLTGDPAAAKITSRSLFTIGFVPKGTKLKKPSQSVINSMLTAAAAVVNGTTTTTTTTTVPSSTSTTSGSTTTTPPTSTTTTAKG